VWFLPAGEALVYQLRIYNAGDPARPDQSLSLQLELRQGERVVYQSAWQPLAPLVVRRDAKGVEVGGQLKAALPAGVYELAVHVRDERRGKTVSAAAPFAVEAR
jgi:hypothetical protein